MTSVGTLSRARGVLEYYVEDPSSIIGTVKGLTTMSVTKVNV